VVEGAKERSEKKKVSRGGNIMKGYRSGNPWGVGWEGGRGPAVMRLERNGEAQRKNKAGVSRGYERL